MERDPHRYSDPADDGAEREERQHGMSRKNEMYGDAGSADGCGKFSARMPNGTDHEHLTDDLAPEPRLLLLHLHVVVDEADGAEAHHHPDDEQAGDRRRLPPVSTCRRGSRRSVPRMKITPPIGVPRFAWWLGLCAFSACG
jgi:hypothetical protein